MNAHKFEQTVVYFVRVKREKKQKLRYIFC